MTYGVEIKNESGVVILSSEFATLSIKHLATHNNTTYSQIIIENSFANGHTPLLFVRLNSVGSYVQMCRARIDGVSVKLMGNATILVLGSGNAAGDGLLGNGISIFGADGSLNYSTEKGVFGITGFINVGSATKQPDIVTGGNWDAWQLGQQGSVLKGSFTLPHGIDTFVCCNPLDSQFADYVWSKDASVYRMYDLRMTLSAASTIDIHRINYANYSGAGWGGIGGPQGDGHYATQAFDSWIPGDVKLLVGRMSV